MKNQAWIDKVEREEGEPLIDIINRELGYGATFKDIAYSLDVSYSKLLYAARNNFGMDKEKVASFETVQQVRRDHDGGESCDALAEKYGKSVMTIRNWVFNRRRVNG